jgi:hypothetical protein
MKAFTEKKSAQIKAWLAAGGPQTITERLLL